MKALILATALAASPAMACIGIPDAYAGMTADGLSLSATATTPAGRTVEIWADDAGTFMMVFIDWDAGRACPLAITDKFQPYKQEPNV